MTKQELEKTIENGEDVWYPKGRTIKQIDLKNTHPIFNGYQIDIMIEDENGWHTEFYGIKDLYKTQAKAEHFLHHTNVSRTEYLPFLTWEEFLKEKEIEFTDKNKVLTWLYIVDNTTPNIQLENRFEKLKMWDLTEENFYKAYDECVRLFKGEQI